MGNARSGRLRYPYPVSIGDTIPLHIETREDYDRLRSAAYKRAERAGHQVEVAWLERRTVTVRRVA